ncbi:MAG: PaaX family transcriptional regulator C-terminal domain-containing protein [bacterium]|nr:PaaX family transcriptional regulator C-terminal domain-containing protein [bacterium]
MGIKERRTKILLSLFLLSDVNFTFVNLDEKVQKIFDLSLNPKTKGSLSGLLKEESIEKNNVGANFNSPENRAIQESPLQNKYRLTEKGLKELFLQFPFCRFLQEKWDGRWRIISYEIPEKKRELRDRFRREMQGWGLGPWHRSFWVTPHPVIENLRQLVSQKDEEKYIQAFEADHAFGDKEVFIEKVWGKSLLDKQYRELFKKWHDILSTEGDKIAKLQKVVNEYVNILKTDPGLPKELVGEQWIGFEGFNIFKEIRSILLS